MNEGERPFGTVASGAVPIIIQIVFRSDGRLDATHSPVRVHLRPRRQARFCGLCVAVGIGATPGWSRQGVSLA